MIISLLTVSAGFASLDSFLRTFFCHFARCISRTRRPHLIAPALAVCFTVFVEARAAEAPLVAIPPVILQKRAYGADSASKEASPLAERVQLALQADPAFSATRFVGRDALETIVGEQTLALGGALDPAATVRAGRLLHADWILRLRLRADDLARPRVEAEVVDALHADLLVRVEQPLDELPNESWLLRPTDSAAALATTLAARALREAGSLQAALAGVPRVAPLAFVDRSPNERLAPLAPLLHAALRRPRPGLHVLGYEAESDARPESALFLAGLTDLDPAAWSRLADAYVWGEFTEAADYSGPAAELPVLARLQIWSDDRGPREIVVAGRFGDLPALAEAAAEAALTTLGPDRISDSFAQRPQVARVLRDSALEMRAKEKTYAARLATLSLFFDPLDPSGLDVARTVLADFSGPATWHPAAVALRQSLGPVSPAQPTPRAIAPDVKKSAARAGGPASRPNSPFIAWRDQPLDRLLAAAEAGPILGSPWLAPDWVELPAADIIPVEARQAFKDSPVALGFAAGSLWFAPRPAWPGTDKLPRPGLWRLPLTSPLSPAQEIAGFPRVPVASLDSAPDGSLWLATRGAGVVVLDPARPERIKEIGVAAGLPSLDLQGVYHAPEARLIARWQDAEGVVASLSLQDHAVGQVRPPARETFPNFPAALRAAIDAYGNTSAPRVRLPESPVFAYEQKPTRPFLPLILLRPHPEAKDRQPDRFHALSAIPTGLDDGYWAASIDTVVWAAGSRLVPLAHWLQGEIAYIADDGRHLLVAVARRSDLRSLQTAPPEPDTLAIHVYDYHAGRWIGRVATPWFYALHAGEGRLLLSSSTQAPFRLADLSTLHAVAPPSEPPPPAAPARRDPKQRQEEHARQRVQDRVFDALNRPVADLDAVRAALAEGAVAATANPDGSQPILDAAQLHHWEAFELLLPLVPAEAWNARPAKQDNAPTRPTLGRRLVLVLLQNQRPDLAMRVIAAGADVGHVPDLSSDSLAWLAIRCGSPELVRTLHAAGWPLSTDIMQHPLREAATLKNAALLRELLRLVPARIDDSTGNGRTPLYEAADIGWAEGVRLLLDAGATSLCGDLLSGRSLHAAASPWPEVSLLLNRRPGSPDNQLAGAEAVSAAVSGDPARLAAVVPDAAVLRYRDFQGWTVLHHAARQGRADFVRRLVASGADKDALTLYGESALCLAVFHGDAALVDHLIRAGAAPNRHAGRGWLPLHAAANAGRPDLVRLLLAARADPKPVVGDLASPIVGLAAATQGDEESLHLLVEAGAPLHAVDADDYGALEAAVLSDSPAKIQYLLDHGARWRKPFGDDYHPMDDAAQRGLTASIRKLQQLGLQSPRALALAKDDATRALLQGDESEAGRRFRADEEQWPVLLAEPDPGRRRERIAAHLRAGGNPSHLSSKWGTPLDLTVYCNDPELVRWLIAQGADPHIKSTALDAGDAGSYRPVTALHRWLYGQTCFFKQHGSLPPGRDDVALAYLPIFWPHELDPEVRETLIGWADDTGLPRAAAWMRAHQQTPLLSFP